MEQYIPLLVSALGGIVFGPIVSRLLGGSGTGGVAGGIIGGVAAHFGAAQLGLGDNLLGDTALMAHLQSFLEGGLGGGVLGLVLGLAMKPRT
ncbi:MAG: hypothetical protein KJ833_10775 [Alphaproteobacteria bacterium]|uniref:hypothetical protein n=1 Tax=Hyphomonas sp. TaxID=87 RepID=UPI001DBA7BB7|nr:hypothetical protein [Hyphomonas sp.]MBU3920879.1 hypothetical protein [Alphaproteobacteria bacterium]MBU4060802.1 hypothetical protein [Alphaproteobacteria bacterium]MBU4164786.1 hypothetical protein [Alphaproteobacteria bacterium]MBU4569432.1 hypothetical protein [Alphaproteobacteria bacterium]